MTAPGPSALRFSGQTMIVDAGPSQISLHPVYDGVWDMRFVSPTGAAAVNADSPHMAAWLDSMAHVIALSASRRMPETPSGPVPAPGPVESPSPEDEVHEGWVDLPGYGIVMRSKRDSGRTTPATSARVYPEPSRRYGPAAPPFSMQSRWFAADGPDGSFAHVSVEIRDSAHTPDIPSCRWSMSRKNATATARALRAAAQEVASRHVPLVGRTPDGDE